MLIGKEPYPQKKSQVAFGSGLGEQKRVCGISETQRKTSKEPSGPRSERKFRRKSEGRYLAEVITGDKLERTL